MNGGRSRWSRWRKVNAGGGVALIDVRERHPVGSLSVWCGGDECACRECDGDGGDGCCFGDWERWMLEVGVLRWTVDELVVVRRCVCP